MSKSHAVKGHKGHRSSVPLFFSPFRICVFVFVFRRQNGSEVKYHLLLVLSYPEIRWWIDIFILYMNNVFLRNKEANIKNFQDLKRQPSRNILLQEARKELLLPK